jgi:hypothetical protein
MRERWACDSGWAPHLLMAGKVMGGVPTDTCLTLGG